jgi:hypothetical protein
MEVRDRVKSRRSLCEVTLGYGNRPRTQSDFINRYRAQTETLLTNPNMFGFCYTQLYDIEQ